MALSRNGVVRLFKDATNIYFTRLCAGTAWALSQHGESLIFFRRFFFEHDGGS
jgi:hypothetical protein